MEERERCSCRRVAIIGVGAVGATTAYAMIQGGVAQEIHLVDLDRRRAEGELMDLRHCVPFTRAVTLDVVDLAELKGCDLIIITAGVAQKPGESRLSLVQRNTAVYRSFFPALVEKNADALFLIITNPVDVMTRVALALSGLPPRQVFGSGTVLDTARFRALLSEHCGVQARHVHAYVIGEHGDSEVLVWSRALIGPFHVAEYGELHGRIIGLDDKERIDNDVRNAAYEIIERKGSTHFAIGLGITRLVEALSNEQNSIFTVSRKCEGLFGLHDICLSVPTLVNRTGAHAHFEIEVSASEHEALLHSAKVLDDVFKKLEL